jgi:hypothetical protein
MALVPRSSAYLAVGALQAEYDGRDARALLEQVAQLNPTSSAPRIRLGLTAESRGDVASAEKWLLDAYRVDRQFETRWTLANFYLRQNRAQEFWTWIRDALEMSYGDRRPVFDLCWRMSEDAREIQRVIPTQVREPYLRYVLEREHWDAVVAAAAGVADRAVLLDATDALLRAQRYGDAVVVWTQAGERTPQGVTASRFEKTGPGFGWRPEAAKGVVHQQLEGGRGHRVRLSGKQAEATLLLSQYVGGLRAGRRYRLDAKIEGAPAGLEWRLAGRAIQGEFTGVDPVELLQLWYVRPRGEVRAEAAFDLREVTVSALQ